MNNPIGQTPKIEETSSRVIQGALFPTSPAPTVRETIFTEILANVLGADPPIDTVDEFYNRVKKYGPFENDSDVETGWKIFISTYTTTGKQGSNRGKKAKQYMVPFHPSIAKCIKPKETRNWGKWYTMLMTSDEGDFNSSLHNQFVDRLNQQSASNIFEQAFIDVAEKITEDSEAIGEPTPIRPYIGDLSQSFQQDLTAWLRDEHDSPSNWLQSARDLFSLHFMNYYLQLSVNLRKEFHQLKDETSTFIPEIEDIYFGLWNETASQDRRFTQEYRQRDGDGIERDIYDSWGRLTALSLIAKTVQESEYEDTKKAYTLSEASKLPDDIKRQCVNKMEDHFQESDRLQDSDIITSARRLTAGIKYHYEQKPSSNQTPITAGLNVIRQLGDGKERKYWKTQRGIGPTLRLNQAALRFLARLFILAEDDMHYDMFIQYLKNRGIFLDSESQSVALKELENMGMIDRQSDSGGAVYVRTI